MANRPTPAFLRPPRARAAAGKTFTRFKAETARPEQQAIFRMMVKEDASADGTLHRALQSVQLRIALGLIVVSAGLAIGHRHWDATNETTPRVATSIPSTDEAVTAAPDVALMPGSRFALSAAARGVEPPAPDATPALTPAVSAATWSLGVAEAHEANLPHLPRRRPEPPAVVDTSTPVPVAPTQEADEPGAGGPFASWVPEPKPEPLRLVPAAYGASHRVNLAVVKYPRSAETIREDFVRRVPWERPLEFSLAPFRGGSLQVLSITGLTSRAEAVQMCTLAHTYGFECVLPEG